MDRDQDAAILNYFRDRPVWRAMPDRRGRIDLMAAGPHHRGLTEVTETPIYQVSIASIRGGYHTARVGAREILILDTREGVRVYDGVCPHLGGPLLEGRISARAIVCPWHAYAYDAVTGRCLTVPGGIWRAGGCQKGDGQPMDIALRPLRHELKDGIIMVYGP